MNRRFLLFVAAALAVAAVLLAVSGGFRTTVGGLRISARSPLPIAILALINFTLWLSWARRAQSIQADLEAVWQRIERHSAIVVAIALAVTMTAAVFSTRSAAGADASGYISESAMLMSGRLFYADELSGIRHDYDSYLTSPLGWRPAGDQGQSPTYPPGLPILMAVPHAIAGINGASAVVILSAAIAIVATALLASQLAGSVAAVIAALLLGFTPIFLHQSIQPMSDIPVTAAWMMSFLLAHRERSLSSGIACAIAVLIRPNLAPLAIVPLFLARKKIAFSIPVAIAGVFLAFIQSLWYGSPLRSGYGSAEELFALSNVGANASRYFAWLLATAPVMLFGVIGFFRLRKERLAQAMAAFAILVVASYLVYAVFDEWSYLRFLLPALAVLAIFAGAELSEWLMKWPLAVRVPLLFFLLLGVTAYNVFTARTLDTFELADQLGRVSRVADFINNSVPRGAVILSGEQSGSMRYYTHRPILRWEAASPEALASSIESLEKQDRPVFIVLDAWENERFMSKFKTLTVGALDWPPVLEAGTSHRTRLWKLGDRDRFLRGEPLNVIRLP